MPLAALDDIVFGGWDIYTDNAYEAASKAGVLSNEHLQALKPVPGDDQAVARGVRSRLRQEAERRERQEGQEQARPGRPGVAPTSSASRRRRASRGWSWCGAARPRSTAQAGDVHSTLEKFEKGLEESHPDILPSMIYAYAAIKAGHPLLQRRAEPLRRHPGPHRAGEEDGLAHQRARTSRPARP